MTDLHYGVPSSTTEWRRTVAGTLHALWNGAFLGLFIFGGLFCAIVIPYTVAAVAVEHVSKHALPFLLDFLPLGPYLLLGTWLLGTAAYGAMAGGAMEPLPRLASYREELLHRFCECGHSAFRHFISSPGDQRCEYGECEAFDEIPGILIEEAVAAPTFVARLSRDRSRFKR